MVLVDGGMLWKILEDSISPGQVCLPASQNLVKMENGVKINALSIYELAGVYSYQFLARGIVHPMHLKCSLRSIGCVVIRPTLCMVARARRIRSRRALT